MDEFVTKARKRANELMCEMFQQEANPDGDPVVELMTAILEDGNGGIAPPSNMPVTLDQWHTWNLLVLNQPQAVSRTVAKEMRDERLTIPADREAIRNWAANLLLSTLDRLGML